MAIKVSIPKALEKKIRDLANAGPVMEHAGSTVRQLISTLDDAYDKKTKKAENAGGLDPNDVIRTVKGVLGGKIFCPPNPGSAFYGFIKARTKMLNVSLQDIERAAAHVRTGSSVMRLPNHMEWFIRKLDQILVEMAEDDGDPDARPRDEDQWEIEIGR